MKEELKKIGRKLNLIYAYSKTLHWNASGLNYYSDHLLFDRISDEIHDLIDGLIETCIIPLQKKDELKEDFVREIFKFDENVKEAGVEAQDLLDLIVETIRLCDAVSKIENLPEGIKTYLTDVSKALLVKGGLLDRRLK